MVVILALKVQKSLKSARLAYMRGSLIKYVPERLLSQDFPQHWVMNPVTVLHISRDLLHDFFEVL